MDDRTAAHPAPESAGRFRRLAAGGSAVLALGLLSLLAFRVTVEVNDRRDDGFCRPDHGIPGAVESEERTWWPVGDRCFLRLPDGTTSVREPQWWLTALLAACLAAIAAGALSRAAAWRRLAWSVVFPALPVAALIIVIVSPRSLARLAALTSISLGYGSLMTAVTAGVVWYVVRGRVLPTILWSWFGWSVFILLQGRDSIGP